MSDDRTAPVLEVEGVSAWYGEARVLTDVSVSVRAGEVVTLVGRNGAGKTTLLRSIMGLHRQVEGAIRLDGRELGRSSPDSRA
jgi:branched-chain amino acid transport system ATP-binding protein